MEITIQVRSTFEPDFRPYYRPSIINVLYYIPFACPAFLYLYEIITQRKKVQCPLYYRRKPSLNFSVTMITFLCEEKSHGFKMRVWIIVHSKLAKNNYFFDV